MPTLIQIDTCLGIGSTGRITESIGLLMKKKGWNCYVVHGSRYIGKTQLNSIQVVSKTQEYLHALGSMLFDKHGLYSESETKHVIQQMKLLKPDIIQLHCIHGYYINYKVLFEFLKEINIPVVWTFHDCWAFTGHCSHFDNIQCQKWKSLCYKCPIIYDYPKAIIDNSKRNYLLKRDLFTSIQNLTIVNVSNWLNEISKQSFFKNKSFKIIKNGIDINIFRPIVSDFREKNKISKNTKLLLGVASIWSESKGYFDFLKLSELLPKNEFIIVMIGVNDKQIKFIHKRGLNIIPIKRTSNQKQLAEIYSAADVFINATYNDTFPTTNLEAIACGTPVITYNTGGSPESIDESTGHIVDKGDLESLCNIIRDCKIKDIKTIELCRNRAEKLFNKDDCFKKYIELYESLYSKYI